MFALPIPSSVSLEGCNGSPCIYIKAAEGSSNSVSVVVYRTTLYDVMLHCFKWCCPLPEASQHQPRSGEQCVSIRPLELEKRMIEALGHETALSILHQVYPEWDAFKQSGYPVALDKYTTLRKKHEVGVLSQLSGGYLQVRSTGGKLRRRQSITQIDFSEPAKSPPKALAQTIRKLGLDNPRLNDDDIVQLVLRKVKQKGFDLTSEELERIHRNLSLELVEGSKGLSPLELAVMEATWECVPSETEKSRCCCCFRV